MFIKHKTKFSCRMSQRRVVYFRELLLVTNNEKFLKELIVRRFATSRRRSAAEWSKGRWIIDWFLSIISKAAERSTRQIH